jgi:hypothetical protein
MKLSVAREFHAVVHSRQGHAYANRLEPQFLICCDFLRPPGAIVIAAMALIES